MTPAVTTQPREAEQAPEAVRAATTLLDRLNAEGLEIELADATASSIRVRPRARLTDAIRAELTSAKTAVIVVLQTRDAGVQQRMRTFEAIIAAAPPETLLPVLVHRADLPYENGRCFSCGDWLATRTYGRCWRCSAAWRLVCGVPLALDAG